MYRVKRDYILLVLFSQAERFQGRLLQNKKEFITKKGVEKKQVWNMTASSSTPIGKL